MIPLYFREARERAHAVVHSRFVSASYRPVNRVDCERRAQAYDHRDYVKPLDVVPVCSPGGPTVTRAG